MELEGELSGEGSLKEMEQRTSDLSATFISVPKGFTPPMKVALVSASLSRKEKKINQK